MSPRTALALRLVLALAFLLAPASAGPQGDDPVGLPAGQSATLLPDGRWLLLGGEGPNGPVASAALRDPRTGTTTALLAHLGRARAWHTATLLPDGTVLILGGVDANGRVLDSVERFDPATNSFEPVAGSGLMPRAAHSATLLTEGRVLIAGGVGSAGTPVAATELWDPKSGTTELLGVTLQTPRFGHRATLLATGAVLLWGGVGADGAALEHGELYEPDLERVTAVESVPAPAGGQLFEVEDSQPPDGATGVPRDILIAVRFSKPLDVTTVNPTTVVLSGPAGVEPTRVTPAEGGMLAFVLADQRLSLGTTYTLALHGLRDGTGVALPATARTFTTQAEPTAPSATAPATSTPRTSATTGAPASEDEEWVPHWTKFPGPWRTGRPDSPWRWLSPLEAPPGVTALAGQVLALNGQPLANVTLEMAGTSTSEPRRAQTDDTGRFLLTDIKAGHSELFIDGRSASGPGRTYGTFEVGVNIQSGRTNGLGYTIWMPKLDVAHAVTIPSPTTTEVVVTTPRIPGLELHIPPAR